MERVVETAQLFSAHFAVDNLMARPLPKHTTFNSDLKQAPGLKSSPDFCLNHI
jgi:hypothetical protein